MLTCTPYHSTANRWNISLFTFIYPGNVELLLSTYPHLCDSQYNYSFLLVSTDKGIGPQITGTVRGRMLCSKLFGYPLHGHFSTSPFDFNQQPSCTNHSHTSSSPKCQHWGKILLPLWRWLCTHESYNPQNISSGWFGEVSIVQISSISNVYLRLGTANTAW